MPVVPMPLKKTRKDPSTNCMVSFEFVNTLVEEFVDIDELVDDDEFDGVGVVVAELGVERTKVLDIVAPA